MAEKALLRRSRLLALAKPVDRHVTSLSNWMDGVKPTIEVESHFLDTRTDLSALSLQETNSLERFLEKYCIRLFITEVNNPLAAAATSK
jgi:hypothetical protein